MSDAKKALTELMATSSPGGPTRQAAAAGLARIAALEAERDRLRAMIEDDQGGVLLSEFAEIEAERDEARKQQRILSDGLELVSTQRDEARAEVEVSSGPASVGAPGEPSEEDAGAAPEGDDSGRPEEDTRRTAEELRRACMASKSNAYLYVLRWALGYHDDTDWFMDNVTARRSDGSVRK